MDAPEPIFGRARIASKRLRTNAPKARIAVSRFANLLGRHRISTLKTIRFGSFRGRAKTLARSFELLEFHRFSSAPSWNSLPPGKRRESRSLPHFERLRARNAASFGGDFGKQRPARRLGSRSRDAPKIRWKKIHFVLKKFARSFPRFEFSDAQFVVPEKNFSGTFFSRERRNFQKKRSRAFASGTPIF